MDTVMERGLTWWDQALFPRDEFEERARVVQQFMAAEKLDALTIWSGYFHTRGDVAYLAGWPMGGALLVLPDGEPVLFNPGGSREHHFASQQVWCETRTSPGDVVKPLIAALEDAGLRNGRIGIVGGDQIAVDPYRQFAEATEAFEVVDVTAGYREIRRSKRPREIMAICLSARLADDAIRAGAALAGDSGSNQVALVEAERIARVGGARDFRGLTNGAGRGLRPFAGQDEGRHEPLILWDAVEGHGYWGTPSYWSSGEGTPAARALGAMLAGCSAGERVSEMALRALAELPVEAHELAVSFGLGNGIGLDLDEAPVIAPDNDSVLLENEVLALRIYAAGDPASFASALVRTRTGGFEKLLG